MSLTSPGTVGPGFHRGVSVGMPAFAGVSMSRTVAAHQSVNFVMSQSIWQQMPFDTVDYNTAGSDWNPAGLFTASIPGWYLLTTGLLFQTAAAGALVLSMYKNGVESRRFDQINPTTGASFALTGGAEAVLAVGDTLAVYAFSQAACTTQASPVQTWVQISLTRPA